MREVLVALGTVTNKPGDHEAVKWRSPCVPQGALLLAISKASRTGIRLTRFLLDNARYAADDI